MTELPSLTPGAKTFQHMQTQLIDINAPKANHRKA